MLKVLELFGGIGACTESLKRLNIDFEVVDYVDNDKFAVKSYNAINGTNYEVQDIRNWNKDIYADLIFHGSPCQDFSLAGKQAGGDEGSGTRSSLMYETVRIIKKVRPKYIIWENVKNVISKRHKHNFDNYITQLRLLGYYSYYKVLNAKDFGIPQNRERVFVVSIRSDVISYGCHMINFKFPEPRKLELKLKDLLEDGVDKKYYLSEKMKKYLYSEDKKYKVNKNLLVLNRDIACSKTTREGNTRADTSDYICQGIDDNINLNKIVAILNNLKIRKLTPLECWRLMGFSDQSFNKTKEVNSDSQLYKQAGNSIVVDVLVEIFKNLFNMKF